MWTLSWILGVGYAVGDALLFRWLIRRASACPQQARIWLQWGFIARYLLAFAVLCITFLVSQIHGEAVVIPLILQKVGLVLHTLWKAKKEGTE